ncbi:MAG TPA: hypothetical protein VGM53_10835 [Streptosporangiaceae bacterium]
MLEDLDVDDSAAPAIAIAPAGASWDEVADHVKIMHNPVLVGPGGDGEYTGAYWAGNRLMMAESLGTDQDDALADLRDILLDRGDL